MSVWRTLRYHWLKFLRLQDNPQKIAWGMALGVFIGITPTVPFHTVMALTLATLLRVSPVAAFLGIQAGNPLLLGPIYLASYKIGQFLLYSGAPLKLPETYTLKNFLLLLWQGGLALQVGGVVLAAPPALASYFLTLWVVRRYRQRKARKAAGVLSLSQSPPAPTGPEA
jgi:uncharacterized protein (DUF2062 family)